MEKFTFAEFQKPAFLLRSHSLTPNLSLSFSQSDSLTPILSLQLSLCSLSCSSLSLSPSLEVSLALSLSTVWISRSVYVSVLFISTLSRSLVSLSLRSSSQQKVGFFISFMLEKHVKIALLSDFSCIRMFFFCLWNDLRVKFGFLCYF